MPKGTFLSDKNHDGWTGAMGLYWFNMARNKYSTHYNWPFPFINAKIKLEWYLKYTGGKTAARIWLSRDH